MSVQTGVEPPAGPASERLGDRMRYRLARWRAEPNPLWMREMRQSARLLRTPIILMALAVLITLLMASIGGVMTGSSSPADAGTALFHTYFSLAFFVVALVGPALGANSIASEREGKTWEAVLLTGMRPEEVARGKFLASYTAVAVYIVMLAPAGAIPFLFGGITPLDVLVAFVFLFLIALLSVAFGLAISSKMESLRGALLVTLLVAVPLSAMGYVLFGPALSELVHDLWDTIPDGPPVWLPTAYSRAPFGTQYVVYLFLVPLAAITLPAWLLYEITHANLTSATDDRGFGLKRWYLVASPVLAAIATLPMFELAPRLRAEGLILGMGAYSVHVLFSAFLFAGEPIGPSRRARAALAQAGRLRRALGPGVAPAASMQLITTLLMYLGLTALGLLYIHADGSPRSALQGEQIAVFAAYAIGFSCFVIALSALLRARASGPLVPRVLLVVILFCLVVGPWILAAITGELTRGPGSALVLAAPSPAYAVLAVDMLSRPHLGVAVPASVAAASVYGGLAVLLFGIAQSRCRRILRELDAALGEADARLAEEDRLREEQLARLALEAAPPSAEDAGDPASGEDTAGDDAASA